MNLAREIALRVRGRGAYGVRQLAGAIGGMRTCGQSVSPGRAAKAGASSRTPNAGAKQMASDPIHGLNALPKPGGTPFP